MIKKNELIMEELLNKRGLFDKSDIEEFLSEKPKKTYDPFLLLNLEAGVDLILSTIKKGQKICIYGDYDCDGITSVCILLQILSNLTDNIEYYIPSRLDEGYGLNKEAISKIKDMSVNLIITVDCGSVSYEEVELAKELGMEIIITDHHNLSEKVPQCLVINPKQKECKYPFKGLSGCGVAFKMAQGIREKAELPKAVINQLLDLVAIGTIGDIVPLIDENRTLTKYGMKVMKNGNRLGLTKLVKEIGLVNSEITSENIAYAIVPHINSAGRVSNPSIAVDLLNSKDYDVIEKAAKSLLETNKKRKKLQEEAYKECISIIEESHLTDDFKVVLAKNAHEGIAGIVAGKIKDKYGRPSIILTENGEFLKGTGRSITNVNLYEILKGIDHIFEKFGGHSAACGFSMDIGNLNLLRKYLDRKMVELYEKDNTIFSNEREIDYLFLGAEIDISLINEIEKIAPFGHSNPKPYFKIENVIISKCFKMGALGNHIRFNSLCQDGSNISCVLFGEAEKYMDAINANCQVSIYGTPNINLWNGNAKIQFVVDQVKC